MTLVMTIYSPHCQGFMGIFQGKENDILINTHFIVRWIMHHYSSVAVLIPSQRSSIKQYWQKGAIQNMEHVCDKHSLASQLKISHPLWNIEEVIRLMLHRSVSPCDFYDKYPGNLKRQIKAIRQWLKNWSHCLDFDQVFGNEEVELEGFLTLLQNLTDSTLPKGTDVEDVVWHSRLDEQPGFSFAHHIEQKESELICNDKSSVTLTALSKQSSSWAHHLLAEIMYPLKFTMIFLHCFHHRNLLLLILIKNRNPHHHHGAHHSLA